MTDLKATFSFAKLKSFGALNPTEGSALVLGSPFKGAKAPKELQAALSVLASCPSFSGKAGECVALLHHSKGLEGLSGYAHLIGFGIGTAKDCFAQNVVNWGGRLARELSTAKVGAVDIYIDSLFSPAASSGAKDAPKDFAQRPLVGGIPSREEFMEFLATGLQLALYKFDRYKSKTEKTDTKKSEPTKLKVRFVSALLDDRKAKAILERVEILAQSVYITRDLQTTPANDLYPAALAQQAQVVGKKCGLSVQVWDEKKLKSEGMNGILSVGKGSENQPRLVIMEHNASKQKKLPTLVLVGKGVTFDTGGICLKPAPGMEEMKMDMSGAAAVVGAMHAIAELDLPLHVVGLLAAAENMPSHNAVKPGDVYTAYDGQTVEVINTDAEGRLVLSDALAYAKTYEPDCVIDIATLTGAVVIALGSVATGMMGNNAALLDGYRKASEKIGEKVWELPLFEEYRDDMRSKCADYRNSGGREAGSQKGGTFLNFFVKDAYPWIHLDIAGTAYKQHQAHCPPDVGSGIPVRGLVEFASKMSVYLK
ncbi:MAG: leucyl aminopeptidase [Bdellovibrionales bacterium]|nr:leucyl aminopeptidase [Bdellovibrionales bacterium]